MSTSLLGLGGLYPEGELARAPRAEPLRKPSIVSSIIDAHDDMSFSSNNRCSSAAALRQKRESYNLSGSVFLIAASGATLKLPIPSNSPADPLGWGRWKRVGAFLAVYWYSIVSLTAAQAASMMFAGISLEFETISRWQIKKVVTVPTLLMGVGAFVWVPLTIGVGRRPAFLLSSLVTVIATLCAGFAKTFEQLLACVCFLGLGEGFALTAAILIIIDLTFIDGRPCAIAGIWSVAGFFGTAFVAIIPYMTDRGLNWRHFYHYWSIPATVGFLLVFFLFPETYFKRPTVAFDGLIVLQTATEKLTVYKDTDADSDIYRDLPDLPNHQRFLGRFGVGRSPFASWTSACRCYMQIAFCIVNPLIFWALVAVSVNFAGMVFIGATHARVLSAAPYNLSSALITPVNLSCAVGSLVAYPVGVLPVMKILNRLAKRNRGVREAEHYLVGIVPPVLTGAMSTLIYGLAVHYSLHFSVYYIAYGLNGFSWVALAISTTLWVTEAFPRWAAPALAVLSGGGYLISFGMSSVLVPWIDAYGYKVVGMTLSGLQIAGGLVAMPIAFWGKSARQAIQGRWADERGGALRPL
ncbi:MFS general substrate transporter [Ophiobolus disseminans]|uniref:MFS general substrate transporter n=1 Tax=Ophiobolus disseminans TaxID=1469910 RepID=A0A6A7A4U3_9PLEO|nr:MFS general substrate transporter [Ophiobolus disseminans]